MSPVRETSMSVGSSAQALLCGSCQEEVLSPGSGAEMVSALPGLAGP